MQKLNPNILAVAAMVCATALGGMWMVQRPSSSAVDVVPVVVEQTWEQQLTATLKAENNPQRITQLRNLWAGFAQLVPQEAKSIIAVERMNNLAGSVALDGLGPRNEKAAEIIVGEFEKNLVGKISDPLDDIERELIRDFYQALADAAEAAL